MGKAMAYDVFISYRRETGANDARLLQQALKARGYGVFFDYDSLRDGKFDESIFTAIDEAPVFVLMLTERALDRCTNAGDWVRLEIERAIAQGTKIISVAPSDQQWGLPGNLPESLRSVMMEQASELNKASLFEESVDKMIEERFPGPLKLKLETGGERIVSTVVRASELFVGREQALAELHGKLAAGKAVVVTGPGGTGKSELARQYAARYKAEYPGGLFQIDMEKVNDWSEAFARMIEAGADVGCDMRKALGVDLEGTGQGDNRQGAEMRRVNPVAVRRAFARRAESLGPLLLVLDNVESTKVFLREQALVKLDLHCDVRIVATARMTDVAFRPCDRCVELPLPDLTPDAALELLLKDHPAQSDAERDAAVRIAGLLGYRVLYLKAIPAMMDDIYSSCAGSYEALDAALRENLLKTVSDGVVSADDSFRAPSALWNMTRKALAAHPCGADWVKLAQIASFFTPEGFRKCVLRHLWGRLVDPKADADHLFDRALNVLRAHGVVEVRDETLSMHRLTRAAVRCSALADMPEIEDEIGRCLSECPGVLPSDWVDLAESLDVLRHIPENQQTGSLCVDCLLQNPSFAEICQWDKLDEMAWTCLLSYEPQFADKCPWETLDALTVSIILKAHPEFAEKCPWDKFSAYDRAWLLQECPDLIRHVKS